MSVAKGRLYIGKKELSLMLGLPESVEILAIKPKVHEDGFELLLVSVEETAVTVKGVPLSQIPRVDVELEIPQPKQPEKHVGMATITVDSFNNVEVNNGIGMVVKQDEKDIKAIFEDVFNKVNKK